MGGGITSIVPDPGGSVVRVRPTGSRVAARGMGVAVALSLEVAGAVADPELVAELDVAVDVAKADVGTAVGGGRGGSSPENSTIRLTAAAITAAVPPKIPGIVFQNSRNDLLERN